MPQQASHSVTSSLPGRLVSITIHESWSSSVHFRNLYNTQEERDNVWLRVFRLVSNGTYPLGSIIFWFAWSYLTPALSEAERKANLAKNQEILAKLELSNPVFSLPSKAQPKGSSQTKAKPIQPAKKAKTKRSDDVPVAPTRQSARLRKSARIDSNESPEKKRKREVCCYCSSC